MNTHTSFTEQSSLKKKNNNKKKNKNKENTSFLVWYEFYPRKIGKPKALLKFESIIKNHSLDDIIEGTKRWCDYWKNSHTETKFIPHPTTFLSQERFMDTPEELDVEVEYQLDTTGRFFIGFCAKCDVSAFYRKEELRQDSKCCKSKILPSRDINEIQDINAEA